MDHLTRSRNRAAVVLAISVIALLLARAMPDAKTGQGLHMVLMIAGTAGTPISAVWMLVGWNEAKRYRRLKAGEGVIARWTVDPRRWDWFREQSKGWDKRGGVRSNQVNLDQAPGPTGIEIVVTGESILIGTEFRPLEKNVAIRAYPEWMEFHSTIWRPKGPAWHVNLRIPLAPDGQIQAERIIQSYREAHTAALRNPPSKIVFFLLFIGSLAAVTAVVTVLAHLLKRGS